MMVERRHLNGCNKYGYAAPDSFRVVHKNGDGFDAVTEARSLRFMPSDKDPADVILNSTRKITVPIEHINVVGVVFNEGWTI
jgi:hypothetical protein